MGERNRCLLTVLQLVNSITHVFMSLCVCLKTVLSAFILKPGRDPIRTVTYIITVIHTPAPFRCVIHVHPLCMRSEVKESQAMKSKRLMQLREEPLIMVTIQCWEERHQSQLNGPSQCLHDSKKTDFCLSLYNLLIYGHFKLKLT